MAEAARSRKYEPGRRGGRGLKILQLPAPRTNGAMGKINRRKRQAPRPAVRAEAAGIAAHLEELTAMVEATFPGAWDAFARLRAQWAADAWPEWCWSPIKAAITIAMDTDTLDPPTTG